MSSYGNLSQFLGCRVIIPTGCPGIITGVWIDSESQPRAAVICDDGQIVAERLVAFRKASPLNDWASDAAGPSADIELLGHATPPQGDQDAEPTDSDECDPFPEEFLEEPPQRTRPIRTRRTDVGGR